MLGEAGSRWTLKNTPYDDQHDGEDDAEQKRRHSTDAGINEPVADAQAQGQMSQPSHSAKTSQGATVHTTRHSGLPLPPEIPHQATLGTTPAFSTPSSLSWLLALLCPNTMRFHDSPGEKHS